MRGLARICLVVSAPDAGNGGLIAVDKKGNIAMPFNSGGMHRGYLYKEKGKETVTKAVGIGKTLKIIQE